MLRIDWKDTFNKGWDMYQQKGNISDKQYGRNNSSSRIQPRKSENKKLKNNKKIKHSENKNNDNF